MVRAWSDGSVEVSDTREGEDGFIYGVFEDGTTFTTDVPNVVWGLPTMTTGKAVLQLRRQRQTHRHTHHQQQKVTAATHGKTKCGNEKDASGSNGKGASASAAMQSHIEEARASRATGRTYIAGVFGEPRERTLAVDISETCHPIMRS